MLKEDNFRSAVREEAKDETSDGRYRTDIIWDFIHCMKRPDGQSQFSRLLRDLNRRADAKLHNHIFSITGPAEPQSQALLLILSYKQRKQHGRVVRAMDLQLRGSEFESHPYHNLDLFLFPGSNS